MIGRATVSLVLKEQGLTRLPEISQWPQAMSKYTSLLGRLLPPDRSREPILGFLRNLGNFTWSQVGSGIGVLAHLSALYYIGQLAGGLLGWPFNNSSSRMTL